MSLPSFAVTWDYRCPFARNAHEHLITSLEAGAEWEVEFVPFSLSQVHVEEDEQHVWDDPAKQGELLSLQVGTIVNQEFPEYFLNVHRRLFAARHDLGQDLADPDVLVAALTAGRMTRPEEIIERALNGDGKAQIRHSYENAEARWAVFGVPTFICGDQAAFVRIMNRPEGNSRLARETIEQVVTQLVERPNLNEFKRTRIEF